MTRFPFLTCLLVAVNYLVYVLETKNACGCDLCYAFGLVPAQFAHGGPVWPLATSLFLHDPENLWHIAGNMAFLGVLGVIVEIEIGSIGFAALYLIAGIAGGLMHVAVDPSSTAPLVGASGAIFGVLAVAAVLRPRLLGFAVAFAGVNVLEAFFGGSGSVSVACHIGGFAAGVIVGLFLRLIRSGVENDRLWESFR